MESGTGFRPTDVFWFSSKGDVEDGACVPLYVYPCLPGQEGGLLHFQNPYLELQRSHFWEDPAEAWVESFLEGILNPMVQRMGVLEACPNVVSTTN